MMRIWVQCAFVLCLVGLLHGRPDSCPCKPRQWRRVTIGMIKATFKVGINIHYKNVGGGAEISGSVYSNGCGKGPGSGAVTYISGDWTHIRYTQEFHGSASCWKIFGTTASPKYRKGFAFNVTADHIPPNHVKDLDTSVGDGIFNEYRMHSLISNKFDGHVYRCDNTAGNFWHTINKKGVRRATVVLRRSDAGPAGISTETSCGTPSYVIKDIWVLI